MSARKPQPWTEAHQREALRRTYEIAAELAGKDLTYQAKWLCEGATGYAESEAGWRSELSDNEGPYLKLDRINREVARVRALAEGRLVRKTEVTTYGLDALRCDGCRDAIAEGEPRWERESDGNEYCEGCRRDAGDGDAVARVKVRRVRVTRIRRAVPR